MLKSVKRALPSGRALDVCSLGGVYSLMKDMKKGLLIAATLTLWLRSLLTVIGVELSASFSSLPITTNQMELSQLISPLDRKNIWSVASQPFHRFDALWYEGVARTGYDGLPKATPFFPLFPFIVSLFSNIFRQPFYITAYILNTIFTASAFFFLFRLVRLDYSKEIATRTVVLFALFPASFFLLAPYAESLLFTLIFLTLILSRKNKLFHSAVCGILAAMTKPYGFIIALPLIIYALKEENVMMKTKKIISSLIIPAGTLAVLFFQNTMLGNKTFALSGGISGWGMKWVNPLTPIGKSIQFFLHNPFDLPNDLNLFSVILIVYFLIGFRKKIARGYWVFTLVMFLFFTMYQPYGVPLKSFSRYFLTLFPVFIGLAQIKLNPLINVIYITTSLALMVVFFIFYTFGFFVF